MTEIQNNITIIGAGSWGLAIARLLGNKGLSSKIWDKDIAALNVLKKIRKHPRLLPWLTLPENVEIHTDVREAVKDSEFIIIVVPSHAVRSASMEIASFISKDTIVICCSKGLEPDSMKSMSQVLKDTLLVTLCDNITVLSGPSHAEEVSKDIPTTVTVAGSSLPILTKVQDLFTTPYFRVYTNTDLIGVEMGGSLKNVIAIAAGTCDGLGFGDNTKAALITRGLAEITRLGVKRCANPQTFSGLAGLGDLVVTCTSQHSRNRKFGELKAKGYSTEKALDEIGQVVEGVKTTEAAYKLANKNGVEMPITSEVYAVIYKNKNPRQAVIDLMTRDPKTEFQDIIP